jgi:hypothetical protein
VAFLIKDVTLFAASFYLLKQDLVRAALPEAGRWEQQAVGESRARAAEELAAK